MNRLGVDVGGTFTDIVYISDTSQRIAVYKVPSTPADPSEAVIDGIRGLGEAEGIELRDVAQVLHGTTIATNIVIERSGSTVGMITTRGFRDLIYIGRHRRPKTFSIYQDLPWREPSLAARANRLVVSERIIAPAGEVLVPLDEDEVRAAARQLRDAGVEAITICFLFSFLNGDHEDRAREIVLEEHPDAHVSVSHEVVPLHREYERFSAACLNSYVAPKTARYLDRMQQALADTVPNAELGVMTSNGGMMPVDAAVERPAMLLTSGPVAGVICGIRMGQMADTPSVITLDVGGTSADVGVAPDGALRMKQLYDTNVGGYEVMLPMVDLETIGAGGGSIAKVDAGGLLRVGPRSARATPGPACYGRGGEEATATDAQVVLGRIRPDNFLGGRMALYPEKAHAAVEADVAGALGRDVHESAMGILRVLNHNMVRAIELSSVRKGFDPRDFALVAFGGAGPLSACDIAQELSMEKVIVPRHPGLGSAMGLLATDLKFEVSRTVMAAASEGDVGALNAVFHELEAEAAALHRADGDGEPVVFQRWADCRYLGQAYELQVPVRSGALDADALQAIVTDFADKHEREYFWRHADDHPVQIVHLRVHGIRVMPDLDIPPIPAGEKDPPPEALAETRPVGFLEGTDLVWSDTPFYTLEDLRAGNVLVGPCVVEHLDSTTVVNPGFQATVDPYGNLILRRS